MCREDFVELCFKVLEGGVFHSTNYGGFKGILRKGKILPMPDKNPAGFCQCDGGVSGRLGCKCLSLSDFRMFTAAKLKSRASNAMQQVLSPWARGNATPGGSFSFVADPEALEKSKIWGLRRIQNEFPDLLKEGGALPKVGHFVWDSEICYAGTIDLSSIKRVVHAFMGSIAFVSVYRTDGWRRADWRRLSKIVSLNLKSRELMCPAKFKEIDSSLIQYSLMR